jgi:hypothetical protein
MSQSQYIKNHQNIKAGEIVVKESKRGTEFHAFNFQRGRLLHIGTLSGQVYEKVAVILRQPEPSFALTQAEFGKVQEAGARFIRIVTPEKTATYAISLEDFQRFKEAYHNPTYGPQLRCALTHFASSSTVAKRNPIIDNPVSEKAEPVERAKQLTLLGWMK